MDDRVDDMLITSRHNPAVRSAAALLKASEKSRNGLFLCEGARLCRDAVLSGISVKECFYTEKAKEKYPAYLDSILPHAEKRYAVEEHVAQLLSSTKNSQGVFCVCREPGNKAELEGHWVVLEDIQDPGNLGAVLRTAEAMGIGNIVLLGECCDMFSPKALRACMGAAFRIYVEREASAEKLRDRLHEKGISMLASVPDSGALPIKKVDFSSGKYAVLIGNEGNGLRKETVDICDEAVTIPMKGRAESLNASAAATVMIWEMVR